MKDYLLFKKLHTSKFLPSMYWIGVLFFCAFFYFLYTDWVKEQTSYVLGEPVFDKEKAYYEDESGRDDVYCEGRYVTPKQALKLGCIQQREYEQIVSEFNAEKKMYEDAEKSHKAEAQNWADQEAKQYRLYLLIVFVIIQLFWRIYCEWWKRLFTFFNRKSEAKDNTNESLIKGIISLDKEITIPFYIVFYLLGALGSLIGIIALFGSNIVLSFSETISVISFLLFFQLFWRLIFEFYVVVFNFLKR